jgi:hypothetical protein
LLKLISIGTRIPLAEQERKNLQASHPERADFKNTFRNFKERTRSKFL